MEERKAPEPVFKNAKVGNLFTKWRQVWLMAMERRRKLQDALDKLNEVICKAVFVFVKCSFFSGVQCNFILNCNLYYFSVDYIVNSTLIDHAQAKGHLLC